MNDTFRPCVVIPVYNHGDPLRTVVGLIRPYGLPIIAVDDGSDEATKKQLAALRAEFPELTLFTLERNLGKGGAVKHGLVRASEAGYTHALQIDADGQHDLKEIGPFLAAARAEPEALIAGCPVYDESVPSSRRIGRKITDFWVAIETLSRDIEDAMCGFRVYPLAATEALLKRARLHDRMTFDIEILVRLHWRGVRMRFLPIKVVYPEGGVSHFRMFRDNAAISGAHTLLFFGMLVRFPLLIVRKAFRRGR